MINLKVGIFALFIVCLFAFSAQAERKILVMAEHSPPFFNMDQSGYSVDLLKEIEKRSDFSFEIKVVDSFARAWREVVFGRADMVMNIVKGYESDEIQQQLLESEWYLPLRPAFFYKYPSQLTRFQQAVKGLDVPRMRIGLPFGNTHYGSSNLNAQSIDFHEARMENLVQMLEQDRIDGIWCMKLNVTKALEKHGVKGVESYDYPDIVMKLAAGFRNTEQGAALRSQLQAIVAQMDLSGLFPDVFRYGKRAD